MICLIRFEARGSDLDNQAERNFKILVNRLTAQLQGDIRAGRLRVLPPFETNDSQKKDTSSNTDHKFRTLAQLIKRAFGEFLVFISEARRKTIISADRMEQLRVALCSRV